MMESAGSIPERARLLDDGQIVTIQPVRARMRYEAVSYIDARPQPHAEPWQLRRALRLPPGFNPRARSLAESWRAAGASDAQLVERAVAFIREAQLVYTLEPPLLGLFLQGRGWTRVDPTVLAAPGRLEAGLARAVREEALPLLMRPELAWLRSVRYNWEALTHQWNLWVLGYSPERQRELMASLGMRDADWRNLAAALFSILGAFVAALLVWSLRRTLRPDPVQSAWRAFCRKLGERGLERAPHEGPRDFAERAAAGLPASSEPILRIGALYIALRYGRAGGAGVAELRRRVREFKPA
jgi:hypothetical protein